MQVGFVEFARHVGHHGLEQLGVPHGFVVDRLELDFAVCHVGLERIAKVKAGRAQEGGQHMVVQVQQLAQLGGKALGVLQVLHAQRAAGNLVFVGRADATAGGADLLGAALLARGFARHVQRRMERQDQRTGFADAQARTHLDTGLLQPFDFFEQLGRRQHHAVADVALDARAHDAAGDQVQRGLDAIDDQRVAGVVAALEAHHALRAFGQPVDQLALALVAPLGADDHDVSYLWLCSSRCFSVKWLARPIALRLRSVRGRSGTHLLRFHGLARRRPRFRPAAQGGNGTRAARRLRPRAPGWPP